MSSRGRMLNTGSGPSFMPVDIKHPDYVCLLEPNTAFWSLVKKDALAQTLQDETFIAAYMAKAKVFADEMANLRFGLGLSAVYVNPTARCNLNCTYCYIPEDMRQRGARMSAENLHKAMEILKDYFKSKLPQGRIPQIIFHGAEPMLESKIVFSAIETYKDDFRFGIQTNGTMLDSTAVEFIKNAGIGIGLSLDASNAAIADSTRKTWQGESVFAKTLAAMELLQGYEGMNVICTVTKENMAQLEETVNFFHNNKVSTIMLNMIRCTQPASRTIKPVDDEVFPYFEKAIRRTQQLYHETGHKVVVANFANILISILAPTARRLMCDISPCGGGRVFFALGPEGGMYPCSEFIGLEEFCGGNLFHDDIDDVLSSKAFRMVTGRQVEDISPCRQCAIRHFCGAPCPAEAYTMNGGMDKTGAFCEFYEEQVRLAFRIIAEEAENDFLWDGWDKGTTILFDAGQL